MDFQFLDFRNSFLEFAAFLMLNLFSNQLGPVPNYLATLDRNRANALRGRALWRSFGPTRLFTNQL